MHLKITNRQWSIGGRDNLKLTFCWWHRRPGRLGIRGKLTKWSALMRLLPHTACRSVLRRPNWWPTTPMASAVTSGSMVRSWKPFKASTFLGAIVTDKGSMSEIRSRIAQIIAALTKLKIIWGRQEHRPQLKDQTVALHGHVHIFIFLWNLDINSRNREKDADSGNEKFQMFPWHLVQRPHHQRRGVKQDSESHWTLRRTIVPL